MLATVTLNAALDKYYVVQGFGLSGVHRIQSVTVLPSGKGINVARTAHSLGVPVKVTGVVGGFTGKQIGRELDGLQIAHDFVETDEEARLCLTITDPKQGIHTEILEPGIVLAAWHLHALEQKVRNIAKESRFVVVAGSPAAHSPVDTCSRLLRTAHEVGADTVLDVRTPWLECALRERPFLVKPNREEFEALVGPCSSDREMAVKARRLLIDGPQVVMVSLGEKGSLVVAADHEFFVRAPYVEAISSVGCGDALVGGLLAGILEGRPFADSLRLATAVAAANACHLGAGIFGPEQVKQLTREVEIIPLSRA